MHLIASDAHAPGLPESGMAEAVEAVGGGELGAWLSEGVPLRCSRGGAAAAAGLVRLGEAQPDAPL